LNIVANFSADVNLEIQEMVEKELALLRRRAKAAGDITDWQKYEARQEAIRASVKSFEILLKFKLNGAIRLFVF